MDTKHAFDHNNSRRWCQWKKLLTSHQVAKLLNVWPETLRRWEKEGKLKPLRTETNEKKAPQEELVDDMIAIVTSFSARIYGKRGGRVAKKLAETIRLEVTTGENHS
ncbi:MAG TPA: hypothetical protein DCZ10_06000 [Pelotomaculum sp.]|nr:hypothetical protein [Pelotomaculum sp.]